MAGIFTAPKKAQPGPGAPTGGSGRDTPQGGRERGEFEKDRQGRGTGKDRPPIYKPDDDGERGGYQDRFLAGRSVALAKKKNAKSKIVIGKKAKKAARQRAGL